MSNRTIAKTSRLPIVWAALTCRPVRKTGWKLVKDILYWFFYLQFETRHRPKKRPVVSVDHPLDETIPFRPKDVKQYMFFIPLWMKSISFYWNLFGRRGISETVAFLDDLRLLYRNAGFVYKKCSSTTKRPGLIPHPVFLTIHLTDPHLHCIPSLHVGVVTFNYLKMRRMLTEPAEIEYCRDQAMRIIDTILTVKQHSINCVSAGLFFINAYYPEFTVEECRDVCRNLLSTVDENIQTRDAIRSYTLDLFNWFLEKHATLKSQEIGTADGSEASEDDPEGPADPKGMADPRELVVDFLKLYDAGELELGGEKVGRNTT